MSQMSRRQFFQLLSPVPAKIRLGKFQDFPVGFSSSISIGVSRFVNLESLPEGIRVKDLTEGHYLGLSMGEDGQIYLNTKEVWPQHAVLSSITATAYYIS